MDQRHAPDLAALASLIGDPARARMLTSLMHGAALTATELALEAEVAPSTASAQPCSSGTPLSARSVGRPVEWTKTAMSSGSTS